MDRFDDIWKDRFNSEDLSSGDWNTPDDIVWQNIADATVRKEKRRPAAWILFGLSLIVILLAIFLVSKTSVIDNFVLSDQSLTNTEITEQTNKEDTFIDSPKANTNKDTDTDNLDATTGNMEPATLAETSNTTVTKPTTTSTPRDIEQAIKTNVTPYKTTINNNVPIRMSLTDNSQTDNSSATTPLSTTETKEPNAIDKVTTTVTPVVESEVVEIPTSNVVAPFFLTALPITLDQNKVDWLGDRAAKEPFKAKSPITITAALGATYWEHKISSQYTSDLSAADFNYTDEFGWLLDLNAAIPLGNYFDARLGFQYEQINVNSGHNSELPYDPGEEGADPSNRYALSLATPYGITGAEFRLDRNTDIGNEAVDLLVDFHSGHTIRNISTPLTIQYFPFGKKRFITPTVGVGMGINYLANISNRIESIDTHHSAIQFDDSGNSSFMSLDINQWHYDYRLNLGAQIRWRKDLSIVLNYERVGGLNPIFKQDAYQTKINRHHFNVGLRQALR